MGKVETLLPKYHWKKKPSTYTFCEKNKIYLLFFFLHLCHPLSFIYNIFVKTTFKQYNSIIDNIVNSY